MPTPLAPPVVTPAPLDPHERRAEWRFAVLLLALFAAEWGERVPGASSSRAARSVAAPAAGRVKRTGRLVRPPRSC
jgi:hypothetical protein